MDTAPTLYLPTVAGNFTSAAALGGLGHPDWGWLFLGAGIFSWLALESLIIQRLWHPKALPIAQRYVNTYMHTYIKCFGDSFFPLECFLAIDPIYINLVLIFVNPFIATKEKIGTSFAKGYLAYYI